MRYLVFTNTPAQAHVYRHAVRELRSLGHEVLVLARDYQCTVPLLDYFDVPYAVYGRLESSKFSLARQLPRHYGSILRHIREYDPDLIFGMGSYAAHAGLVSRTPVVLLLDSEHHRLDHAISHPFADALLTPHTFRKDLGANHYQFRGFKECAYLHPDVYDPSPDVRDELGVGRDEQFSIARFNAFGSHHDVGESGFDADQRQTLVDRLAEYGPVFVSAERDDLSVSGADVHPYDLHPARLHDALAEAHLLVADTATMATEAALLGTPAIRSSSFVGDDDFGNFLTLEQEGLVDNFREFDDVLSRATELVADPDVSDRWAERRDAYVADMVNLTDLIVDVATARGNVGRVPELSLRRHTATPT